MKNIWLLLLALTACGRTHRFKQLEGNTVTVTSTSTVTTTESALQQVLDQENSYLESVGQHDLVPGLACSLYTVPTNTSSIQQSNSASTQTWQASFPYSGAFNQANAPTSSGLNILPTALQSAFQTYFIVKCSGYLISLDNNYHQFSLTSDDGSLFTLDGLLINNDGLHSTATVNGSKLMTVGAHWVEIDFFQAQGYESLILSEDGTVMDGSLFYH